MEWTEIGLAIKAARKAASMTVEDLATQLCTEANTLKEIENGTHHIDFLTTIKMSEILNISLDDLAQLSKTGQSHNPNITIQYQELVQYNIDQKLLAEKDLRQDKIADLIATEGMNGNLDMMKELLTDPELADYSHFHSLYTHVAGLAAQLGHLEVLQYLTSPTLVEHANIEVIRNENVDITAYLGQLETLKYLLTSPLIPNDSVTIDFGRVMMCAAAQGYLDIFQYLVTSKELINAGYTVTTQDLQNQLFNACKYGEVNIVDYILNSPDLDDNGYTKPDIHFGNDSCFIISCKEGYLDVVEWLIFNYYIALTDFIKAFLMQSDNDNKIGNQKINELFELRTQYQSLQSILTDKQSKEKLVKI